jgi:hypothetical protein
MSSNLSKHFALVLLLWASVCADCLAQQDTHAENVYSGTLNLLLGNRHGFVIAADSRRTRRSDLRHWDDSQKLFRVGPKSALVIAGFASWYEEGSPSPLDTQVASFLREEFSDPIWTSGKRPITDLPNMVRTDMGHELQLFGAIAATDQPAPRPEDLDFQVLAAGVIRGNVEIVRIKFAPRVEFLGPFDLAVPSYDMESTTKTVEHFVACSAGIDRVARAILDGTFDTRDERILTYYRSRAAQQLDDFSLDSMKDLAVALLEETERVSVFVGGPNQIGVFPRKGPVRWMLPELGSAKERFRSTALNVGFAYTPDGFTPYEYSLAHGKKMLTEMGVSLAQPFDEPLVQVYVGSWFRGTPVSLDGNAFAGNHFVNTVFEYQGGPFYFPPNNSIDGCMLEAPSVVTTPPMFSICERGTEPSVILGRTLGAPLKAEPKGCVTRKPDGRVVVKTKGRQNGKPCEGSGVVVRFQPLGPGEGNGPQ